MEYKVIRPFSDLQDNGYIYNAGDFYPRDGYEPTEERIQELATTNNKKGKVFIKKVGGHDGQEGQGQSETGREEGHEVKEKQNTEKKTVKKKTTKKSGE